MSLVRPKSSPHSCTPPQKTSQNCGYLRLSPSHQVTANCLPRPHPTLPPQAIGVRNLFRVFPLSSFFSLSFSFSFIFMELHYKEAQRGDPRVKIHSRRPFTQSLSQVYIKAIFFCLFTSSEFNYYSSNCCLVVASHVKKSKHRCFFLRTKPGKSWSCADLFSSRIL